MSLRLPDDWLWDFWIVRDRDDWHVFYLKAPRSLGDPDLRHWHVAIGHAVSSDLQAWTVLPDALAPGPPGAWDDYTVWTGSILADGDGWRMLYTGTSRASNGRVQRIGLAASPDLVSWARHPANPVLVPDGRRYETLDSNAWHEEAWRDPWLVRNPADGGAYALVTARAADGPSATRGVIGLARGVTWDRWIALDPITSPGVHGHMEIPQLVPLPDRRWCLLFSVPALPERGAALAHDLPERAGLAGTHFLIADTPFGPYRWTSHGVLLADERGSWYGAKLVEQDDGTFVCLAWRAHDADGRFVGDLSDPMPVTVGPDGPRVVSG